VINKAGLDLIKLSEGLRLKAYQDTGGVWTIGYGTTTAAGVGVTPYAGLRITEAEADYYLTVMVDRTAKQVRGLIRVPVTDNELAACTSLAYNIGIARFRRSTVLRRLNANDRPGAAAAFAPWNKDNGVVQAGLVKRRAAEAHLFLT
jgi:lysozyme